MPSLNKVFLIGHLGRDPELKSLESGKTVCKFSIATSEKWGKADDRKEKTEWHNVVAWGQPGEYIAQYATKGTCVFVEGKIQTRSWEDKDGVKKYATEINAMNVKIFGPVSTKSAEPHTPVDDDIPF